MLRPAGLRTKILAYDHNWAEHPNDIANTPPDEVSDTNNYPQKVLASPAARYVAGTAYHCYYGDPSAMTALHNQFPDKDIYFTECSGSQSGDPTQTFSDTLKLDARTLEIGTTRNWAKSVVNWNLALDPSRRSTRRRLRHLHRHRDDRRRRHRHAERGVLRARPPQPVRPTGSGAHRQHLVRDGRLERADHGRRVPQPRRVNRSRRAQRERQPAVLLGQRERPELRLHAARRGLGDVRLVGPPRPVDDVRSLDPLGWTATASPTGPSDPCCSGDVAGNAVDDDATTRYSTGVAQSPGQYLQVDLGRAQPVQRAPCSTPAPAPATTPAATR